LLKQLLVKRGNPFFLEETVRTLVETKVLAEERGRYRLTQPLQTLKVPPTVQTILAARIDRLAPEDKHLLQVASVVGKDVPFMLLQAIAELPDETLRGGLDRLQAAEFLYETGLYPDLEYSFKHALTHEVAYGALLSDKRRLLHARIVNAIEALHRERLGEYTERLADHALRGELREKAVPLSAAGWTQGIRAVGALRSSQTVRAGARRSRGTAREPVHAGASLRPPARAATGAEPAGPGPAGAAAPARGRVAGRSVGRRGQAWIRVDVHDGRAHAAR
jgi:hypothetical protein